MRWIGHRGLAGVYPENTLSGFLAAARDGMTWVELDARVTADGVPVVLHDATLQRTFQARGRLLFRTLASLATVRGHRSDEGVPTLAAVLAAMGEHGVGVVVEVKDGRAVALDRILEVVDGAAGPCVASSFEPPVVARMRALRPNLRTQLLFSRAVRDPGAAVRAVGAQEAGIALGAAQRPWVAGLQEQGVSVYAYTVKNEADAQRARAAGVDGAFVDLRVTA